MTLCDLACHRKQEDCMANFDDGNSDVVNNVQTSDLIFRMNDQGTKQRCSGGFERWELRRLRTEHRKCTMSTWKAYAKARKKSGTRPSTPEQASPW